MKIDRLIGIISLLLQKGKLTQPQLASKFEVSRRTISRDIMDLCKAGIPIVTLQGPNGGIMLMEEYTIDKVLLTTSEMQSILYGLQCLDSVTGNQRLQKAITRNHFIRFIYYSPKETTNRLVEPYLLIYRWNSWFLWGYCLKREDMRLFKIARIQDLEILEKTFQQRKVKEPEDVSINLNESERFFVQVAFEAEMKWKLLEEFTCEQMKEGEDGRIYVNFTWSDKKSLLTYLLGFGKEVEVIGPQELREEYVKLVNQMIERYK